MSTIEETPVQVFQRALANLADDDLFHQAMALGFGPLGLTDIDFSRALPVDRTTVRRWADGKSKPMPLVRAPIYRFLIAMANGGKRP